MTTVYLQGPPWRTLNYQRDSEPLNEAILKSENILTPQVLLDFLSKNAPYLAMKHQVTVKTAQSVTMMDLFIDRVLVKNNRDQDELDTEREIEARLQNRIVMLFFGSASCDSCLQFAPALCDFFKRLTDEFYVDRSAQLVLLYISMDQSEEEQEIFLKELPKRCLFLAYEDPYRRELEEMFNIEDLPTVVVLRPDGSILIPNAVDEILRLGPDCYKNWQEAAEIIDRNFMISDDISEKSMRSLTDPVRRLKYKAENKKKKQSGGWGRDAEVDRGGGDGGAAESPW